MFTGLIEEVGTIRNIRRGQGARMVVACRKVLEGTAVGHSMAVDGVCLTVDGILDDGFSCFLSQETLARSTFGGVGAGRPVNLERAMVLGGRLGGHLVSGHVECLGQIDAVRPQGRGHLLEVSAPPFFGAFLVEKGSVAVDGVSLTLAEVRGGRFTVALIPETFEKTTFRLKRPGDSVNLEPDLVLKYVRSVIERVFQPGDGKGLTLEKLSRSGFLTDEEPS